MSRKSNKREVTTFCCGKPCEYETSPYDIDINQSNTTRKISEMSIFDQIMEETNKINKENTPKESLPLIEYSNENAPSSNSSLSYKSNEVNTYPGLFEDPETPPNNISLIKSSSSASTGFKRKLHCKRNESKINLKKRKCYKSKNRMNKKELAAYETWAKAFNEHCKEIEAYQLCVE